MLQNIVKWPDNPINIATMFIETGQAVASLNTSQGGGDELNIFYIYNTDVGNR